MTESYSFLNICTINVALVLLTSSLTTSSLALEAPLKHSAVLLLPPAAHPADSFWGKSAASPLKKTESLFSNHAAAPISEKVRFTTIRSDPFSPAHLPPFFTVALPPYSNTLPLQKSTAAASADANFLNNGKRLAFLPVAYPRNTRFAAVAARPAGADSSTRPAKEVTATEAAATTAASAPLSFLAFTPASSLRSSIKTAAVPHTCSSNRSLSGPAAATPPQFPLKNALQEGPKDISTSSSSSSSISNSVSSSSSDADKCSSSLRSGSSSSSRDGESFDVVIVGLGVGGHAAALHAAALGMKTAVITGGDAGGTCVNRGCVPSKALLSVSKKVKQLRKKQLLNSMGIHLPPGSLTIDPREVAQHARRVVEKVRSGLLGSLNAHGVTLFEARGVLDGRTDRVFLQPLLNASTIGSKPDSSLPLAVCGRNIILAPGSTPFVPPGVELDEQEIQQDSVPLVMTSDSCVGLPWLPSEICIVGGGYIGLEFTDVFSSLGSEVTLVDAASRLLPAVDVDVARLAERLLLQQFKQRPVKLLRNSIARSVRKVPRFGPLQHQKKQFLVEVQLADAATRQPTHALRTDACLVATGRKPNTQNLGLESLGISLKHGGFIPVDACMRVKRLPTAQEGGAAAPQKSETEEAAVGEDDSEVFERLFCVGDANGETMLAHAASAQAIAAVETISGRPRTVNRQHIPAACFTSPEIAFVGLTEEAAMQQGEEFNFPVGRSLSYFRANTKAIAEGEADGLLKVVFRKDTGKLLGCHMIGLHASDLIQECATAMSNDLTVQDLAFTVHTHPTLSEVVDAAWKTAAGMNAH